MSARNSSTYEAHERVAPAVEKEGFKPGTPGVIVGVYPDVGRYSVKLFDENGETLHVLYVLSRQIRRRRS